MSQIKLDLAQYSMQYSDKKKQHDHDAVRVYDRNYDWITGTEAGESGVDTLKGSLLVAAYENGYTFFEYASNWISIKKSLMVPGTYTTAGIKVVDKDLTKGPGYSSSLSIAKFVGANGLGNVNIICSHLNTKGRPSGPADHRVNLKWNKQIADEIAKQSKVMGKGRDIVFYGGDQNILDNVDDTFLGAPLTSAWDELGKHENTGHGNIDVIASYDRDKRVKAKYVRALDDKEQFMYSDHFPVEAGYLVEVPEQKAS